ncbi:MAG: DnaJ domain-containing protein [Proteobacteria bacterium]|nr:DnaJ domain-containing protein [Pseudomonadota bacterium]
MRKARPLPLDFTQTTLPPVQKCEQEGCEEKGEFRAPKNPLKLREYYWFCLDHVRDYNKAWDFYKGMSPQEIEASRVSDVTWNRPSWPVGSWRTLLERVQCLDGLDPFLKGMAPPPAVPQEVQKALSTLELAFPLTLEALKKQYKKLVKKSHPDLHAGDKRAEERFKTVNEAYQIMRKHLDGVSLR